MKVLKRQIDRFVNYLYDSSIYIKDRTFILFSICELLALFAYSLVGVFLGDYIISMLISIIGIVVGVILLFFSAKKNKIKAGKIVLTLLLVLFLRPAAFFMKGGINNGALIMLLMGGYFLVLILDGKFRIVMCVLDTLIMTGCMVVSYYYPELMPEYSRINAYILSSVQYIIALVVLTVLITFWTKIMQNQAEKAEEKSKELEELNRSQNRFFSSMSHEIRTPINTVLGMNEIILRQEDASEEIIKDARNIQGAGKMLLALINDILDVSKIEAGKMDIVPVNYNVSSLLSEIVNMIWLKAEEKGLKFNVDIDPDVPAELFGDEVRIKQILINLLNNAVKYTKEGSITLHMECEFPDEGFAMLRINVSDTGMGIKPEALPHLFDTFQRVDEEKNRHIEGTGLGLSIVKQLVELMDGEITVNSVYTEGSTFAVVLKQGISSGERIGDLNLTGGGSMSRTEKFEHSFHAPGARILIVDDNEMNLQVEDKLLSGTELTVDLALSGQEALSLTLKNRYDVIFMDHLMPEMDGIECYNAIRSQKGGQNLNTPVVVLTANAGGENIDLYNNTGFDGYLVKPVSGQQLEDMLLVHLPADKVIRSKNNEASGASMSTASGYTRKKAVSIAAGSMSDLPQRIISNLQISIIPSTVSTDNGVFYDNVDIDSEEILRYMKDKDKYVSSDAPKEEDYVRFFSEELKKAHHLIFITLTSSNSFEIERTTKVAKLFENVTIFNSECVSSGTGILVMLAARMVQQNQPVEKILAELEYAKHRIKCSFILGTTDIMLRRERISPAMHSILSALWLRPMIRTKNDNLGVGRFLFGTERQCYEKYLRHAFPENADPEGSFVFVTYSGMEEEDLLWIEEKLREGRKFNHIIFQKASAGIASNCGAGTFGIIYLTKSDRTYNLGALFDKISDPEMYRDGDVRIEEVPEKKEENTAVSSNETADEPVTEKEENSAWYANLKGIDGEAALRNSGSEEALQSVLKMFFDGYETKSGEIREFYESGDWSNYTIKVHALKSSARLVGALKLGEDAEALEMAGKKSDIGFISANHDALMEEYKAVVDELSAFIETEKKLPDITDDVLYDAYDGIMEFARAEDPEYTRMVIDSLKEYTLQEEDEDRIQRIESCLSAKDWDGIIEILQEVM